MAYEPTPAMEIAALACRERQPMPCEKCQPAEIAAACEKIGGVLATDRQWVSASHAFQIACYYYKRALDQ